MDSLDIITKHFPNLTELQKQQFKKLGSVFIEWNSKVNLISRKDIDSFYQKHVLHSLGIAKVIQFKKGSSVLDIGTGGGVPGIPLAILFPETSFTLVDSINKKITAVNDIIDQLGLKNVKGITTRGESTKGEFDFIVSRAVTRLNKFIPWTKGLIKKQNQNTLKNGILYLKGGDLKNEISEARVNAQVINLSDFFDFEFFETKKVVYISR